jgi:hypothetical protein
VTNGAGEYAEPYVSHDGRHLVCLARRRKGELIRVAIDSAARPEVVGVRGSGDGEPSVSAANERIFISSARSGHLRIWSMDLFRTAGRATHIRVGRRSAASRFSGRATACLHLQSRRSLRDLACPGRRRNTAIAREYQRGRCRELVSRQPSIWCTQRQRAGRLSSGSLGPRAVHQVPSRERPGGRPGGRPVETPSSPSERQTTSRISISRQHRERWFVSQSPSVPSVCRQLWPGLPTARTSGW